MVQTEDDDDEQLFVNTFGNTRHKKTTLGNQQLYIIGNIYKKLSYLIT
jgi:hypothetical protein